MIEAQQRELTLAMDAGSQSLELSPQSNRTTISAVEALNTFRGPQGPEGPPGSIENLTIDDVPGLREALDNKQPKGDYLPAGGAAADAEKLGGKEPKYYIRQRNLLDNSDFTNPVNQRGQTNYAQTGYTIDRWNTLASYIGVSVNDGFISVSNSGSGRSSVEQRIGAPLVGKTVTFAVCDNENTVYCVTGEVPSDNGDVQVFATYNFDGHTIRLIMYAVGIVATQVMIAVGATLKLKWAALYEGEYTADNLPTYVPKGYAAELAECQRYYSEYESTVITKVTGSTYVVGKTLFMRDMGTYKPTTKIKKFTKPNVIDINNFTNSDSITIGIVGDGVYHCVKADLPSCVDYDIGTLQFSVSADL